MFMNRPNTIRNIMQVFFRFIYFGWLVGLCCPIELAFGGWD